MENFIFLSVVYFWRNTIPAKKKKQIASPQTSFGVRLMRDKRTLKDVCGEAKKQSDFINVIFEIASNARFCEKKKESKKAKTIIACCIA